MNKTYYANTAFDSSKIRGLPLQDNSKFSFTTRRLRSRPLKRNANPQCGEFLAIAYVQIIDLLNNSDASTLVEIASPGHEIQPWETLRNPKVLINTSTQVMWFFLVIAWVLFFSAVAMGIFSVSRIDNLTTIYSKFQYLISFLLKVMIFPLIPTIFYIIGKIIQKANLVTDKYNIILNRRKGTILCPGKLNPEQEIPFEDFDPYLNRSADSSGRIVYHLCLCHRYSEEWITFPEEQCDEWGVYQVWEFWQQYMDISKPLPDVPKMEPYRSRDPVTAAYDKKQGRPADYWKNMGMERAYAMQDAALKASKAYPWGLTREQALVSGWRPSGVGEGDWRQRPEPRAHSG